jgi:hypothetical protein
MFGLHPIHALAVIIDFAMGAWLGHDGFQVHHHILNMELDLQSLFGLLRTAVLIG